MNPVVTTNQKPIIGRQKIEKSKKSHQTTREESKRRRRKEQRTAKTARKQLTK